MHGFPQTCVFLGVGQHNADAAIPSGGRTDRKSKLSDEGGERGRA